MTTNYVSAAEFDAYVRDEMGATGAPLRLAALKAAEAAVNEYCARSFAVVAVDATTTTRTYEPSGTSLLRIHDARAVTAIAVSGSTLSDTVYQLEPFTQSWSGRTQPYEQVRYLGGYWPIIVPGQATITVTGRFGWTAVPDEVVEATKVLAKDILQQRNTVGNMAAVGDFGGTVRMNTYVRTLLGPLRRAEAFGVA